jgi:dephospho-CoA kinase
MNRRTIIGLTGNIATGKSTIMRLAADRGALTIDADRIVHDLLDKDAEVQAKVVDRFGSSVRRANGHIDRATLGQIVFNDPEKLRALEQILHPAVRVEIGRRIAGSDAPVIMIEAIKLLEGSLAEACDQIWVTTCSKETQLERLRVCRGLDQAAALSRIDAQGPQEAKLARSDVVIDTGGLMTDTLAAFAAAWADLANVDDSAA